MRRNPQVRLVNLSREVFGLQSFVLKFWEILH